MKLSEYAHKVAERLQQGWCQNALHDMEGNVCAVGALSDVRFELLLQGEDISRSMLSIFRILSQQLLLRGDHTLVAYNNAPTTTQEDIVLLFKELATELELQGR